MNKTTGIIVAIVLLALIGVGIAMTGSDDDTTDTANTNQTQITTPAPDADPVEEAIVDDADANQQVDLVLSNFEFSQGTINAAPGDTVSVNLTVGSGGHDFVIDELDVQSRTLTGDDTETVTFTIPEDAAGQTYAFYCSIGNHRAQGMEGQLVIQ